MPPWSYPGCFLAGDPSLTGADNTDKECQFLKPIRVIRSPTSARNVVVGLTPRPARSGDWLAVE